MSDNKKNTLPLDESSLEQVSGGMRPIASDSPCPSCGSNQVESIDGLKNRCKKSGCGCIYNKDTKEILGYDSSNPNFF